MKDFRPLISVIINCFNGEEYLREAIDSVIHQTYSNWEIIFWDNQSTDSTAQIVRSYNNPKIHYYYASTHTPLGEARNLAVERANGEYINFLDADDVWDLRKLEEQTKLIVLNYCEVIYTPFEIIFGENVNSKMRLIYNKLNQHKCFDDDMYNRLLIENYIIFSSVLISKAIFNSIGGVNVKFRQYEDWELLLKSALLTHFAVAHNTKTYYRVHNYNNTTKNGKLCIIEMRDILNSLPPSKQVNIAKKRNETRYACHFFIKKCMLISAFIHITKYGDWYFLLKILKSLL